MGDSEKQGWLPVTNTGPEPELQGTGLQHSVTEIRVNLPVQQAWENKHYQIRSLQILLTHV